MRRINVYIQDSDFRELEDMPGTISENIRLAIKKYVQEERRLNAMESESGKESD